MTIRAWIWVNCFDTCLFWQTESIKQHLNILRDLEKKEWKLKLLCYESMNHLLSSDLYFFSSDQLKRLSLWLEAFFFFFFLTWQTRWRQCGLLRNPTCTEFVCWLWRKWSTSLFLNASNTRVQKAAWAPVSWKAKVKQDALTCRILIVKFCDSLWKEPSSLHICAPDWCSCSWLRFGALGPGRWLYSETGWVNWRCGGGGGGLL